MITKSVNTVFLRLTSLLLLFISWVSVGNADPLDHIKLFTLDDQAVQLLNDDPVGLVTRPLRQTKQRWDDRYHKDFLQFRKIDTGYIGKTIKASYEIDDGPLRLTIYQISCPLDSEEMSLRVITTGFYQSKGLANIEIKLEAMKNNAYIIAGERVTSADEINSHLKYMSAEENTVGLSGYSTNWNLNKLKLHLAGKAEKIDENEFVKDADWLVGQLINPQWVVFIRADRNE